MRPIHSLIVLGLALGGCGKDGPTYNDLHSAHTAEIERAATAMRVVSSEVAKAAAAPLGGECAKEGLTRTQTNSAKDGFIAGNAEIVSYLAIERYEGTPMAPYLSEIRSAAETRLRAGPVSLAADLQKAASSRGGKRASLLQIAAPKAASKVDNLIVLRGVKPDRIEAFLFDIPSGRIKCSFAVQGDVSEGVEDRDTMAHDKQSRTSWRSSTGSEHMSRVENAPKRMAEALNQRFGFTQLPDSAKPANPSKSKPKSLPALSKASKRLAAMHAQLGADAPACTAFPPKVKRVRVESLRAPAGASLALDDPLTIMSRGVVQADSIKAMRNSYNSDESRIKGANEFMSLPAVFTVVPERFTPPAQQPDGSWSAGTLDIRAVFFAGEKVTCATRWQLVTPDDLKAEIKNGRVTELSAREAAIEDLRKQFAFSPIPMPKAE